MNKPRQQRMRGTNTIPGLSIRIDLGSSARIGPGKVMLLEEIAKSGSISASGRSLKMSYRRAWELIEEMNESLGIDVVQTSTGGAGGGGTQLTDAGREIVSSFRNLEAAAAQAGRAHIANLLQICKLK